MAALVVIVVLAAVVLPQLWVQYTLQRHARDRPDLPGTGGELARHLLNRFDLPNVKIEITDKGITTIPRRKPFAF